jgi:hypothetical protein
VAAGKRTIGIERGWNAAYRLVSTPTCLGKTTRQRNG